MSPCGKQRHIQSQLFGNVHHSIHKAPVSGICRILFDLSGIGGGHFRQAVNQHRLNHIEPLVAAVGQVQLRLFLIADRAQQPCSIPQIEEGLLAVAKIAAIFTYTQFSLFPRLDVLHP